MLFAPGNFKFIASAFPEGTSTPRGVALADGKRHEETR
jgi:hypothetical protein